MIIQKSDFFPALLLLVLLSILIPTGNTRAQQAEHHFLLLYSNDMRAELEPCG